MSIDFYLDRASQARLIEALGTIPTLADQLAVTVTRQARIQKSNMGKPRRQKPGSRMPFHIGASEAADQLHTTLATWVRHTCEHRQIHYRDGNDLISLARWLRRNMIQLALTEGSTEAFIDIRDRIDECQRQVDLPPDDEVHIDQTRIREANRQVLTAGQVEKIAHRLGALGQGLNKRRVETLARNGRLRPCAIDGDVRFYRLGDVLDAHHRKRERATP
ncbi:hypothetical protein [Mycolicibacterium peregrinum]|uniref:hypothetical protein n=1 Tax=Mycolicibacterium peregrinum TaxID=43304 RepID=UPI003AAE355D